MHHFPQVVMEMLTETRKNAHNAQFSVMILNKLCLLIVLSKGGVVAAG